jgi:hypothetical protein
VAQFQRAPLRAGRDVDTDECAQAHAVHEG